MTTPSKARAAHAAACVAAALAAALIAGCGKSPEEQAADAFKKQMDQAAQQMQEASKKMEQATKDGKAPDMQQAGEAMGAMMKGIGAMAGAATGAAAGGSYEPVDFRKLKEVVPAELPGMKADNSEGSKNNAFGIQVSEYKASFRSADDKGDKRVNIEVTDPGSLTGPFALAHMWMGIEVDKESSSGYEKTSTVNGRRMYEKWDKSGRGEVTVVVGNRFLVQIDGRGLTMDELKALVNKVDLAKLDAMKNDGKKT
jgi:hypothetical protein